MLRAHIATGVYAALVAPGTGTAHRVVERLSESDTPAGMLDPGQAPKPGVVGVLQGPLRDGVIIPGANLVVITETDCRQPGQRRRGHTAAAKRRRSRPAGAEAGDLVVHDQHGIGRFVEMVERTVGGTPGVSGAGVCLGQEGWRGEKY
ncbi:transcription-repair coupling factor [Mycobacterium tuberculosis CAS/NITR204]|uniref:Transcription-repair coupling factor n=1 Tax=Mycobacterium tuberculosis CAS/NITR204 TaxID=1310114 RepID=R4M6S2_MYCTX|nr:transcription-repair coupling factor [Mycobacterium tuberculosis CAS/NITR204]